MWPARWVESIKLGRINVDGRKGRWHTAGRTVHATLDHMEKCSGQSSFDKLLIQVNYFNLFLLESSVMLLATLVEVENDVYR